MNYVLVGCLWEMFEEEFTGWHDDPLSCFFFTMLLFLLRFFATLSLFHSFFLSFFFHYKERLRYKVEIEHYFWKNKGLIVQFLNNRGYTHSLGAYFLSRVFGDGKRCWNHGQHSYALVRFLTYSFRTSLIKNHLNYFKSILGCARILSEIFMWHNQRRKRPLQNASTWTHPPTNKVKQCRTCFLYASLSLIVRDVWRSQIKIQTSQMERGEQITSDLGRAMNYFRVTHMGISTMNWVRLIKFDVWISRRAYIIWVEPNGY